MIFDFSSLALIVGAFAFEKLGSCRFEKLNMFADVELRVKSWALRKASQLA
eukprot:CAMPEP_0173252056 /NCGR_PEP_ID=MMETSP1142-20121109/20504_1 /TAXON_ID=483371 /ORGANISM="non described non described, Strain CCMP2298" /LENGTH=50 /DNA_ID=CAMNT_0014185035 /DNA_START=452 /DNA_END=601 /DNA_ORIENTATION=+